MMAASGSNQGGHRAAGAGRKTAPLDAGGEPLPHLLADAIDSLGAGDDGGPWSAALTAEDLDRLKAALGRRAGRVNLDAGLAADLVEAVLPEALASLVQGPGARRRLAERIAGTLLDDPVSAARLQTLVTALGNQAAARGRASPGGSP
jgi:hypothetical protein